MMIQFLCPNGHKIHCSEDRAGKPAKCPKCGIKFRIPLPSEMEAPGEDSANDGQTLQDEMASGSSPGTAGVVSGPATAENQIEFLCPNNHLLHGPSGLQGQPGECPECGSRFRIPSYEEMEEAEEEQAEEEQAEPEPTGPPAFGSARNPHAELSLHEPLEPEENEIEDLQPREDVVAVSLPASGLMQDGSATGSLATLFPVLWSQRGGEVSVELRYSDGQELRPDQFLPALSRGSHGVFAVHEPNGTFSLIAVDWKNISSVTIHGLKKLPGVTS
ncbi:MAG: hypothetical protein ACLQNE_04440 [Thermoguttaceae bacterium]